MARDLTNYNKWTFDSSNNCFVDLKDLYSSPPELYCEMYVLTEKLGIFVPSLFCSILNYVKDVL